MSSKSLGLK